MMQTPTPSAQDGRKGPSRSPNPGRHLFMERQFFLPLLTLGSLSVLSAFVVFKAQNDSWLHAQRCIELKGDTIRCSQVTTVWLQPDILAKYNTALKQRRKLQEADEEKRRKLQEANEEKRQMEIAAAHARMAEADAKFKSEGWWEESNGVYVRWCSDANPCPGSANDHYTDQVWRAMVWCKERACGDIYARLNIIRDGVVIGWTNDTAYGDSGQKVVLTFGSHLSGEGRIVEFIARG